MPAAKKRKINPPKPTTFSKPVPLDSKSDGSVQFIKLVEPPLQPVSPAVEYAEAPLSKKRKLDELIGVPTPPKENAIKEWARLAAKEGLWPELGNRQRDKSPSPILPSFTSSVSCDEEDEDDSEDVEDSEQASSTSSSASQDCCTIAKAAQRAEYLQRRKEQFIKDLQSLRSPKGEDKTILIQEWLDKVAEFAGNREAPLTFSRQAEMLLKHQQLYAYPFKAGATVGNDQPCKKTLSH